MEKIFEIVSKISTPLGISGLGLALLLYVVLTILGKKIEGGIIKLIINWVSVLCLISLVLGCGAFVISLFYPSSTLLTKDFNVYIDNKPAVGVIVKIDNIKPNPVSEMSTPEGQVSITFDSTKVNGPLHMRFFRDEPKVDHVMEVALDTFPRTFPLHLDTAFKTKFTLTFPTDQTFEQVIEAIEEAQGVVVGFGNTCQKLRIVKLATGGKTINENNVLEALLNLRNYSRIPMNYEVHEIFKGLKYEILCN